MYVVCKEHVEDALDDFLVEYEEQAPDVHLLTDVSFTAWVAPAKCEYCEREPRYLVI